MTPSESRIVDVKGKMFTNSGIITPAAFDQTKKSRTIISDGRSEIPVIDAMSKGSLEGAPNSRYAVGSIERISEAGTTHRGGEKPPRRRTAQPNQRQKMMEKIRDAKLKAEKRLRDTLMGFYETGDGAVAGGRQQEKFDAGFGPKDYWGKRGASLSRLADNTRFIDLNDEELDEKP